MSPYTILETLQSQAILLPIAIFFARIIDVSIGTMRIVMVARGHKIGASLLGFFECLLWTMAVTQILADLHDPFRYFAFAAGFATGNFVGLMIEERLALGYAVMRVITRDTSTSLLESLRNNGFGVTQVTGMGREGRVDILFSIVKRKRLPSFVTILNSIDPNAFYSVEDVRSARNAPLSPIPMDPLNSIRKAR